MLRTRREFLHCAGSAGVFLLGCGDDAPLDPGAGHGGEGGATPLDCPNPFAGGELLGVLPFADEDGVAFETELGQGWDGRLYTDLTKLVTDDSQSPLVDNEAFYIRTFYPDLLVPPDPWILRVSGLAAPVDLTLPSLLDRVVPMGAFVLECSGNHKGGGFGLMSAAEWSGIPLADVLDHLDVSPSATRVLVSGFDEHSVPSANGHSTPGASWIFSLDELANAGAFLATEMNGQPLPPHHGAPVRLYVPNWYGCSCIKWVNEIVFVDDGEPATSQMQEFASRTHQLGVPALAKDYTPATMDQAAMPVRIEQWRVGGQLLYRVAGILWGGYEVTDKLQIRYASGEPWAAVDVCPVQSQNRTWTTWTTAWAPPVPGLYRMRLRVDDPSIPTRRLDVGYYDRDVQIVEV